MDTYVVVIADAPIEPHNSQFRVIGPFPFLPSAEEWAINNPHYITEVVRVLPDFLDLTEEEHTTYYNRIAEHDAGEHVDPWEGCPTCEGDDNEQLIRELVGL